MDFQEQLLKIDQRLNRDEAEALAFLCKDLMEKDLSAVTSASLLFSQLKHYGLLEITDHFIISELLFRTRQFALLKILGTSKQDVEQQLPSKGKISLYRQMLYDLSENITTDDLKNAKFLLQNTLPKCKLEDNMSMLKLLLEMEKADHLDENNLETLEKVIQIISPSLMKKISKFKNENRNCSLSTQETTQPWEYGKKILRQRSAEVPSVASCHQQALPQNSRPVSFDQDQLLPPSHFTMPVEGSASSIASLECTDARRRSSSQCMNTLNSIDFSLPYMSPLFIAERSLASTSASPMLFNTSNTENNSDDTQGLDVYEMKAEKIGYCLIINNYSFEDSRSTNRSTDQKPFKDREGTNRDAEKLVKVFEWLGFETERLDDCNRLKILDTLKQYQEKDHSTADCFVCCVLSHGQRGEIYGVDGRTVPIKDFTSPFSGIKCLTLREKPKIFFIQACQGDREQLGFSLETDGHSEGLSTDAYVPKNSIPNDSDFLLGMATVDDYVSFRDKLQGSWYIQTLCENLQLLVPRGEDLLSILTKVNMDVSKKSDKLGMKKQIPQPAYSLRKKVIFPKPVTPPPLL
ncbi:caspase-8 [Amia ocellicauda]|uniref:caspase-8 n=1 Tax=Amia ocellicauda TaxID=2972642 RepID=UPI003464244E